jgi:broad specificity phosphatase PhoE
MVLPVDLILVRHGQSMANVVQRQEKEDENYVAPDWYRTTHDSKMKLSPLGETQAAEAGNWLRAHGYTDFNRYFVSPHTRASQTAGLLALNGQWQKDDRWRERDWGEYGMVSKAERKQKYGDSTEIRSRSEWYWKPTGGESLATGVRLRFDSILDKLHRETSKYDDESSVIVVAHGEMLRVAQFVLEQMTPDDWNKQEEEDTAKIANCQIIHYTRRNPITGEIGRRARWRRAICPWDETKSWHNGEWREISGKLFTDAELLDV